MKVYSRTSFPLPVEQLNAMVEWLSGFTENKGSGVTRLLYSEEWLEAQEALKRKMEEGGLDTYYDDTGNLFGRLEGTKDADSTVLTGSHIDSVVNGGKYDGAYGIIASFLAVEYLYRKYGRPSKTIEVVSLCEEEGSRFPLTFWGSGNITGIYKDKDITHIADKSGVSLKEAMNKAGFGRGIHRLPYRENIEAFIELHIEQGSVLEKSGNSLGVVTHIVGQRRYTVSIKGKSNHAGTTPMQDRHDAMTTAAELITYITAKVQKTDPHLVATVGKLDATPNVPNVIAGEVSFTLDIRHYDEGMLGKVCAEIFHHFEVVSQEKKVNISFSQWTDVKPVEMDASLQEKAIGVSTRQQLSFQKMLSGAGHDAQLFGTHCPTSLIFVPSVNGVSHSPEEYTKAEDLTQGVQMLTELLYEMAYDNGGEEK
ncbi:allantoate deiminase [Bacillus sp. FJAT-44742]|uniref:allantoate deiminase n=1 Tax=Bacillus sp. FJAT-44742 TaxID=2014005 RepID=UPI000C23379E|nr:allantoate deiminase [Bacillus sp. FJAT-44742]